MCSVTPARGRALPAAFLPGLPPSSASPTGPAANAVGPQTRAGHAVVLRGSLRSQTVFGDHQQRSWSRSQPDLSFQATRTQAGGSIALFARYAALPRGVQKMMSALGSRGDKMYKCELGLGFCLGVFLLLPSFP